MEEATIVEDGQWDIRLYNILLDLRGVSGIVDLTVALKEENGFSGHKQQRQEQRFEPLFLKAAQLSR